MAAHPVATYVLSASAPKEYVATAIVQVQGAAVDTSLFTSGPIVSQTAAIAAAAQLAETPSVARKAARRLNPRPQPLKTLMDSITVTSEEGTGFVTLDVRNRNPQRAADVANAYAAAPVAARSRQARAQVNRTIQIVRQQLAAMGEGDPTGRAQLSEQLQRLRALEAAQTNNAVIVQPAVIPDSPVSPKPIRNAILAFVLGLLAGVGLAFLFDRLDRRVRRTADLRRLTRLADSDRDRRNHVPAKSVLAVVRLRGDQEPASPPDLLQRRSARPVDCRGESGPSRGQVDGGSKPRDQPRPQRPRCHPHRHGPPTIQAGGASGIGRSVPSLGSILASGAKLESSLTEIESDADRLRVVPAGPPPPNPSELIDSSQMGDLLKDAEVLAEIVVISTPPCWWSATSCWSCGTFRASSFSREWSARIAMRLELGSDIEPFYAPARTGDLRRSSANVEAVRAALGFVNETGLRDTIAYYQTRRKPAREGTVWQRAL